MAHSLMEAAALTGMHLRIACPGGCRPLAGVEAAALKAAEATGARLELVADPRLAVAGARAVYTDVWVSMGEDAERERRLRELAPYRVTRMTSRSAVWRQAENRMHTEQALLYRLLA